MAIRNIRMIGDDILTKKCKVVKEMTEKNKELIADMFGTMYDADVLVMQHLRSVF